METKKILYIEDHKLVRLAIKRYLEVNADVEVLEANNGMEGFNIFCSQPVEIIITDINMPKMGGLELVKKVRKENSEVIIIALTMLVDPINIKSMLRAGTNSYVLKEANSNDLLEAVELAKKGLSYYCNKVSDTIMSSMSQGSKVLDSHLTKRELEVLERVLLEMSNKEIAAELFVSVRTVEAHKHHIMEKTGSKNMAGLVKYALREKLFGYIFLQ